MSNTLVINYRRTGETVKPEVLFNVKKPENVLRRRNIPFVKSALYNGTKIDLKPFLALYSPAAIKDALDKEMPSKKKN